MNNQRASKRQSSLPLHLAKLYSTAEWTRRSKAQRRHYPLCAACRSQGVVTKATVADHITQAKDEDSFLNGTLQSLCGACHQAKRQAERWGKAWKPKLGCDERGMPLDPEHGWNR